MLHRSLESGRPSGAEGRRREMISARDANFRCDASLFGNRLAEDLEMDYLFIIASSLLENGVEEREDEFENQGEEEEERRNRTLIDSSANPIPAIESRKICILYILFCLRIHWRA